MKVYINGFELNSLFYITNVQGVHDMPPSEGVVNNLVTCSNSYYVRTLFSQRVITLTCVARMDDGRLLADKMDIIKRVLAPTGEKELRFSAYPDRYIMGRIEGTMDMNQIGQMGFFNIVFYCSEPFYYDSVQQSSITKVTSFNCENKGSWTSRKLYAELTMPKGDFTISNQTTGQSLRLRSNVSKNILIDFEKAALIGGVADNVNNMFVSGEFFELVPGNNQIVCTTPTLLRWRSCYL